MAVQFGRWNLDGSPFDQGYLDKISLVIAPHGPDGGGFHSTGSVGILYRTFFTTKESRRETQPYLSASGTVITMDGLLDNRAQLIPELKDSVNCESTDIEVVAAAYERWGTNCFARLLGDWALSFWRPKSRSLILAKDFAGTRQLYYARNDRQITWSTTLDPLVLFAGATFPLEEEYVAGLISSLPATHLTPYRGVYSVPPASFVQVCPTALTIRRYWDFDPAKRVRYCTDTEYEEHFRAAFNESIRRRLRSDSPILAELSGGVDSSSIVCMADKVIANGTAETPRLDTVSYYDDSEPNWNERPYFTKVEEKRGRVGCHIDVSTQQLFKFASKGDRCSATPSFGGSLSEAGDQLAAYMLSRGNRTVLSGVGGDEVTGGVPTPVPELQDLFALGRFRELAHQLKLWALVTRKPWFHLVFEAARAFFPPALVGIPRDVRPVAWLDHGFARRYRAALTGYPSRVTLFGSLPSFQDNISTLDALRRQLACRPNTSEPPYERRYPYLDRELLEFIYAIPREQLARPHQRRSLMRRALIGIVPGEILNRRRKAFVTRGPMAAVSAEWTTLNDMTKNMLSGALRFVDSGEFAKALQTARQGQEIHTVAMMRTLAVERWLRQSQHWHPFSSSASDACKRQARRNSRIESTAEVNP